MEALGIDWKILLAQIINFVFLIYLLRRFAFIPLLKVLKERKQVIEEGIKNSEQAKEHLEETKQNREKVLENAQEKASELVQKGKERGKEKEEKIIQYAEEEKEKILEEAKNKGNLEVDKMKQEQKEKTRDLGLLLAEKILKEKIDAKKDQEIVKNFLLSLENNETKTNSENS